MEVILLERVAKLGQMGETVKVRSGYARNFLLPRGKALRASEGNKKHFEAQRAQLEARNLERRKEAEVVGEKLNGQSFIILRQSGETGVLYGSVSTRDLAEIMTQNGFTVDRNQIALNQPIKTIGLHNVPVALHPEVEVRVTINVARSPEEAERQARGEAVTARDELNLDDLGLEVGAALAEAGGDEEI
ncbi:MULTISPECIES: 50S ribosomal protein L9 [Microvirga]|jgi:large subunit ribosomal protein L9|uniref:Large ribosomal subunit protein bL9 n=1 Tax=Microvirga tunisiensis TaxID=2108360 RepID=A0A5N7MCB5_9HYPH|nr:50S ribosomal protein L9 [Microvirga tunisiensis]MPR05945.1 50S ribosomal protein L9 [Microvirga tunisiensis]MPR24280.1 50S ribosomal protein L9 [Microvirga tunisiensis]